jgi:hypothetical protein
VREGGCSRRCGFVWIKTSLRILTQILVRSIDAIQTHPCGSGRSRRIAMRPRPVLAPAPHRLQDSDRIPAMQPVLTWLLNDKKQSGDLARTCTELHRCQRIGGLSECIRMQQGAAGCTQSSAVRVLGLRCRPNTMDGPQAMAEGRREHWGLKAAVEMHRRAYDE